MGVSHKPCLIQLLTLIAQCHASSHSTAVCGQLDEEAAGSADQPFNGQVFHLVRVVDWGRIDVVPIPDY